MGFLNRLEASLQLAHELAEFRDRRPVVFGIARGGVGMAKLIADSVRGDLGVILVDRIPVRSSGRSRTFGIVNELGDVYVPEPAPPDAAYHPDEAEWRRRELCRRRSSFRHVLPPTNPAGRVCIIVDDGAITGATLVSALRVARYWRPSRLVAAVAVASKEALGRIAPEADEVRCLQAPEAIERLDHGFEQFPQVTERDVLTTLLSWGLGPVSA
jgi:putative phosphoribosyl transferase